ncbi:hypothetical protein ACFYUR_12415 [Micromonospora haikouensis]|uniref:hypothetical protein n=1 Tax=Micromonospora haikouensis TaxID=686309 RepID=UPI0036C8899A
MSAPTITTTQPGYRCVICGTIINTPGCCDTCQNELDAEPAAKHAAQTRALVGDPIAEAIRTHLATLTGKELLAAEHRAQIRVANANRGVMDTKRRVDTGIHPQSSLDAARDEVEAARLVLGLVHERQQLDLHLAREAEAAFLAGECRYCGPEGATGPDCGTCPNGPGVAA